MSSTELLQWAFTVLGAAAAAQQLARWVTGRRADRGLQRFLESYEDKAEAEMAGVKFRGLTEAVAELEAAAPQVARRLYLQRRAEDLADSIGAQLSEYADIQREVESGASDLNNLRPEAKEIIEVDILPRHGRREQDSRRMRLLLTAVVLLLVVPYQLAPATRLTMLILGT
jgi:hypothetical protein